jgi:uncharacterized protein YnzC (UPF0291/DUF896 family)
MNGAVKNTEAAIWNRVVSPDSGDLDEKAAESILRMRLPGEDLDRVNQLAEKAREGRLTIVEESELENYRRVGRLLELLKSKARQSLKRAGVSA